MTITETTSTTDTETCPPWCQSRHPGDELHIRELGPDPRAPLSLDLTQEDGEPARVGLWLGDDPAGSLPADPDLLGAAASAFIAAAAALRNYGVDGGPLSHPADTLNGTTDRKA